MIILQGSCRFEELPVWLAPYWYKSTKESSLSKNKETSKKFYHTIYSQYAEEIFGFAYAKYGDLKLEFYTDEGNNINYSLHSSSYA